MERSLGVDLPPAYSRPLYVNPMPLQVEVQSATDIAEGPPLTGTISDNVPIHIVELVQFREVSTVRHG